MGSFTSLRKAYGALKDSTTVSLASINSDFKDLDIAIVKATNHVEAPPKERHVRRIFAATSVVRPRADVAYCIHALSKRLNRTHNWIVAMKVLIVIHRTLREGDPTFREELMNYSHRGHILHIANFKDESSPRAWDCAGWVRTYALYLEERLECFRILKFDIEAEHMTRASNDITKVYSRTRVLTAEELLEQLPALQQLIFRLVGCQPEGGACTNFLIQYSLATVLKESFKIYCAINDGIINLVDLYFDMSKHDAVKALHIYKRAGKQTEILAGFYEFCKRLELGKNFQFPTLRRVFSVELLDRPPPSFLATMEEYVKEAPPQTGSFSQRQPEIQEKDNDSLHEENPEEVKYQLYVEEEKEPEGEQDDPEPIIDSKPPTLLATDDLLGLNDIDPKAEEIEESNALALAITSNGKDPQSLDSELNGFDGTGWELALVSAPSNNTSNATDSNLGGGFNKLLLDSLYEDNAAQRQYEYGNGSSMQNPFEQQQDPFAMSNSIAPPTNVQMSSLAQQQQMFQQQQNMNMMYYQNSSQYSQHQTLGMNPSNPFGDPLPSCSSDTKPQHGNADLL